jgi:predicted Zn-dependent protease with MMP-like domain
MTRRDPARLTAPDAALIESLALEVLSTLPPAFRQAASEVGVMVEELAPDDLLDDLDVEDPFELTGVYEGTPLTDKTVSGQPTAPDLIRLFRRAILDEWIERGDIALVDLVRHVMIHELAHHFGWTDDEIAAIDRWWE